MKEIKDYITEALGLSHQYMH